MKIILTTLLLCSTASCVYGANILVAMPLPTFSHTNAYLPIFTELAKRGHNVTMVSPFPQKKPIPNYNDIVLKNTIEEVQANMVLHSENILSKFFMGLFGIWPLCDYFLKPIFEMPEFKEFLKDKNLNFDLVILESVFCQQPLLALGQKYSAPVITMVPAKLSPSIAEISGNPNPFAYVPVCFFPFSDHMTFLERVQNTFTSMLEIFVSELYGYTQMDSYMRKHLSEYPGFENLPTVSEMQRNISLFMVDNHFSLSYPQPYQANVVEFGGLSINSGGKLPADLEKLINESKDGVIFFTWGSHYKMTNMKPELLSAFMSVFSKLNQRVLMKWENDTLPGKPDNVKIDRWFPQSLILSHPKIRLFITHGGIHGVTEAIYYSVPMLGTPIFGDQSYNLQMAQEAGMALNIDIDNVTEDELLKKVKKLLDDPKYKENAVKKSLIMKDRPLSALDNAVYWVEYVLRHKGARHLHPGSLDLAWYQNLLLDVIAASLAVLIAVLLLLKYTIKFLCNLICKRKANKNQKDKKIKNERKKNKKE